MTLLDLGRLIRRYWVLVVALSVICAVVCAGFLKATAADDGETSYKSVARIITNSQSAQVNGFAQREVRTANLEYGNDPKSTNYDPEAPSIKATAGVDNNTMTVTITVTGDDFELCNEIADGIAERSLAKAELAFADNANKDNAVTFSAEIEYSDPDINNQVAQESKSTSNMLKYVLVALLAGLFIAICVVVIIDMVRRPVKSIEGAQETVELPVLEKLPIVDDGERLLANVRFASKKDDLQSVCVVPVKQDSLADSVADMLVQAAEKEGMQTSKVALSAKPAGEFAEAGTFTVARCNSLAKGMGAAYAAKYCDAVVLIVSQWSDSLVDLETAVAEFKLADTNLIGLVFSPEVKSK